MRVDVIGMSFQVTDAIRSYAEGKVEKLLRYFDAIQLITVRLAQPAGRDFEVELVVDAEKHEDFVAKAAGSDLYLAIDAAVQKMSRQLTDFKEKLKLSSHHPDHHH